MTFQGDGFSFEYPGQWQVIKRDEQVGLHGPILAAAVGIGHIDHGCTFTSSAVTCPGQPTWTVPEDGIVVAYRIGARCCEPFETEPLPSLEPGESWVSIGGRPARLSQTDNAVTWKFPGPTEFIEARWGSNAAAQVRAQVEALIASWEWTSTGPASSSPGPLPT